MSVFKVLKTTNNSEIEVTAKTSNIQNGHLVLMNDMKQVVATFAPGHWGSCIKKPE